MALSFGGTSVSVINSTSNPVASPTWAIESTKKTAVLVISTGGTTSRTGGAPYWADAIDTFYQIDTEKMAPSGAEQIIEVWRCDLSITGNRVINIPNSGVLGIGLVANALSCDAGNTISLSTYGSGVGTTLNPTIIIENSITGIGFGTLGSGRGSHVNLSAIDGTRFGSVDRGSFIIDCQYKMLSGSDWTLGWSDAVAEDWAVIGAVFYEAPPAITGSSSTTIGAITQTAAGTVVSTNVVGASATTLAGVTQAAAGTVLHTWLASTTHTASLAVGTSHQAQTEVASTHTATLALALTHTRD